MVSAQGYHQHPHHFGVERFAPGHPPMFTYQDQSGVGGTGRERAAILSSSSTTGKNGETNNQQQEKQQPSPPNAPRSAFMCFTDAKKSEIIARHHQHQQQQQAGQPGGREGGENVTSSSLNKSDILKLVADEWRRLSDKERSFWDEEARNDKVR